MKLIDKFLKLLQTDRNTFVTYILTLLSVYFVIDRLVEILFLIFTGISVSYWGPFMYTFALACPVFAFLFGFGSKFASSNAKKSQLFYIYVISLYILSLSMVVQWTNSLIWTGLLSLPGFSTLAKEFPEVFKPALISIALYLPLVTAPKVFKFLYGKVYDTRLLQESIWDYGGIKLTKNTTGTGTYSCEMFVCTDKESGRKAIIPENSRFNQFLVVGPSGTGKTSLVFEPMMARDIEKKFFFKTVSKEMGFTALKTGIANLNAPYNNDYLNKNFNLNMLSPVSNKLDLFKTYFKKMIIGESGNGFVYRNLGLTSISPDFESIEHMIQVAENFNMPYNLVDPNDQNSIGLNPFVYDNPLKAAGVFANVLKAYYQSTQNNVDKVNVENTAIQAIENICVLLKTTYPIIYKDRDYLPTLEDVLKMLANFDKVEETCKTLEEVPEIAENYGTQLNYFRKNFYKGSSGREKTEAAALYASTTFDKLLRYPGVKNIVCNRTRNINFDNALANGEITFVCTRRGDLGATLHKSFGIFFLMLMQNSVLKRPGNENTRVPHFLYIDEFPEFISPVTEPIFTLYRKYRVGTTISSQTLAQLGDANSKYRNTITSNCMNKLVFGGNSIEENTWWSQEFGNVRYWKFGNTYDTSKGEYDPKLSGIEWAWKAKFAPDKVRSLTFKSCLFKWKNSAGVMQLADARIDFMDPKYKEPHKEKSYDFETLTKGISDEKGSTTKKKKEINIGWKGNTSFNQDSNGDVDPIKLDTSDDEFFFNNPDSAVFDLKKGNPNG